MSDDDDRDDDDDEEWAAVRHAVCGSSSESVTEISSEFSSSGPDSESDHEEASTFVNHYANVNETLKKTNGSWKRGATSYVVEEYVNMSCRSPPPMPVPRPPSYQTVVMGNVKPEDLNCPSVSLNGFRNIVNKMAGIRAPLPGFSSFV